jgi:hypothetical protein
MVGHEADVGAEIADIADPKAGPLVYRHDPRLLLPSYRYFTREQVCTEVDEWRFHAF